MKTLRLCAVAISFAATMLIALSAQAATRVYELGGLGCPFLNPAASLAVQIRGAVVQTGCYFNAGAFESDALAHRGDRIVVIGHSMGAKTGAEMADDLARHGVNVKMIALDALYTGASAHRAPTVHFWQGGYPMPGAVNVRVPSAYGHIGFPSDPRVQAKVLAAAGGGMSGIAAHHHASHHHVPHHHHRRAA